MSQVNVGEEFRKAQAEPLLPVEKKLIGWSSRHWRRPAGHSCHRQPTVPGVDLTPRHTTAPVVPPRNGNEYVANSEDRALRRRGD